MKWWLAAEHAEDVRDLLILNLNEDTHLTNEQIERIVDGLQSERICEFWGNDSHPTVLGRSEWF